MSILLGVDELCLLGWKTIHSYKWRIQPTCG